MNNDKKKKKYGSVISYANEIMSKTLKNEAMDPDPHVFQNPRLGFLENGCGSATLLVSPY